jgi:preprotein translocase subunit SecE
MNTWFQQTLQFFKEAYAELRKVSWLSRKEVIASTVVVIILVIVVAIYVGITDFVLARILGILI